MAARDSDYATTTPAGYGEVRGELAGQPHRPGGPEAATMWVLPLEIAAIKSVRGGWLWDFSLRKALFRK
jgi:hypothetical protein